MQKLSTSSTPASPFPQTEQPESIQTPPDTPTPSRPAPSWNNSTIHPSSATSPPVPSTPANPIPPISPAAESPDAFANSTHPAPGQYSARDRQHQQVNASRPNQQRNHPRPLRRAERQNLQPLFRNLRSSISLRTGH